MIIIKSILIFGLVVLSSEVPTRNLDDIIKSVDYRKSKALPPPPMLTNSYLPAVMQAVAYYVELLQYEITEMTTIEPPFTLASDVLSVSSSSSSTSATSPRPQAITVRPTLTPGSNKIPVKPPQQIITTTTTTTMNPSISITTESYPPSTSSHKPGYFAPIAAPVPLPIEHQIIDDKNDIVTMTKPTTITVEPPLTGPLPLLSISTDQFFNWFLQMKESKLSLDSEYDLQYLHQLPAKLLQNIQSERYEQPALLDNDNIQEFLRIYDDFYGRNHVESGRKKIPPTRPYVQMLMLYDLLKREAKRLNLHKFEGYSPAMLQELSLTSYGSAERQLYTLMYEMIKRNNVEKLDIIARCKLIMKDVADPTSITAKALRFIPPLKFLE